MNIMQITKEDLARLEKGHRCYSSTFERLGFPEMDVIADILNLSLNRMSKRGRQDVLQAHGLVRPSKLVQWVGEWYLGEIPDLVAANTTFIEHFSVGYHLLRSPRGMQRLQYQIAYALWKWCPMPE